MASSRCMYVCVCVFFSPLDRFRWNKSTSFFLFRLFLLGMERRKNKEKKALAKNVNCCPKNQLNRVRNNNEQKAMACETKAVNRKRYRTESVKTFAQSTRNLMFAQINLNLSIFHINEKKSGNWKIKNEHCLSGAFTFVTNWEPKSMLPIPETFAIEKH